MADRSGRVRYRVAGRVPQRAEANRRGLVAAWETGHAWTGWVDPMPAHEVPPDGQVVTANERRGPESDRIGTSFAPPHRADRIGALLDGRTDLTVDDMAAIHADARLPILDLVHVVLEPVEAEGGNQDGAADLRRQIMAWDGSMTAESAGAAAYAAWRHALVLRVLDLPALAALAEPADVPGPLAVSLDLPTRVGLAFGTLLRAHAEGRRPFGADLGELAAHALADAAGTSAASWGQTHRLRTLHAFDGARSGLVAPEVPQVPLGGDVDTVRCTGSASAYDDSSYRGSVARYVWDLADRGRSGWVVVLGASADPRSPHHLDQLDAWAQVRLLPVVTDWERLTPC